MTGIQTVFVKTLFLSVIIFLLFPLFSFGQRALPAVKEGIWQGTLHRPDSADIVFNFTISKAAGKPVWYVHNAGERLLVDSIRRQGDSLFVQMPFFASRFALAIQNNGSLKGTYIKNYGTRQMEIPFTAVYGKGVRYTVDKAPRYRIGGIWQAQFDGSDTLSSYAIGEFSQDAKGIVTGTFRTATGDYRYLEGSVDGDSLRLSAFDGGHAILFAAHIADDNTLTDGVSYSGLTGKTNWTAKRNDKAKLPDSYNITKMRPGETSFSFRFPSTDGVMVSNNDAAYKGKVVIIQILGSWCPNCMDETAFLSPYYKANKQKGLEVIGLAYERTEDFNESKEALQPFRKRFGVQYPFLVTGVSVSDSLRAQKTLPQLDDIKVFPTTIFISKKGEVDKIHSGYDGPATGVHYEEFKKEFDEEVNKLLSE